MQREWRHGKPCSQNPKPRLQWKHHFVQVVCFELYANAIMIHLLVCISRVKKIVGGPSCGHQMHGHWLHYVGLRCLWEGSRWGWDPHEVTKTSRHHYCIKQVALLEYFNKCKRCSLQVLQTKTTNLCL